MLRIQNLKSGYDGMEVLHGIDLAIKQGEIVSIIGPNGSGKSTILKSIFGLAEIYNGSIKFNDVELAGLPTYKLINLGISFVPQGRQVFSDLTVQENLDMGAYVFTDKKVAKENLEEVFTYFPVLCEKKNQDAGSLSGGQQQMLSIGRALIQKPKLILMDEPSLGLSPKMIKEVFTKIVELNQAGLTVIIVEQNAKQAVQISHRTYVLEGGNIALEGGRDILDNPAIRDVYFGGGN